MNIVQELQKAYTVGLQEMAAYDAEDIDRAEPFVNDREQLVMVALAAIPASTENKTLIQEALQKILAQQEELTQKAKVLQVALRGQVKETQKQATRLKGYSMVHKSNIPLIPLKSNV